MKKQIFILAVVCVLLSGCSAVHSSEQSLHSLIPDTLENMSNISTSTSITDTDALPNALYESYYLSSEDQVFAYLQNNSIKKFFDMWFEEYIQEDVEAHWNYDTLAPVQLLNHDFDSIARSDVELYTCTFSTDDDRYGYIIVSYSEDGPHIKKWSLHESTPCLYDLRANSEQIAAAIMKTDIDLSTATATRVEWIDTDKNRGDRIILFSDGKGDRYICYLGDDDFSIERQ